MINLRITHKTGSTGVGCPAALLYSAGDPYNTDGP
jgi:hypothetical protein